MSSKVLFLILFLAAAINLVGAFGPEVGFDALWYHLTLPSLYKTAGQIYHVPGGLLYYSELPRLGEMLFLGVLGRGGDVGAHLISWGAGIGACVVTYKLARKYLDSTFALLATTIFYVTPLVGWQSGSGYVDLIRTLFEVLAVYLVVSKKVVLAGVAAGLAVSTKTLALGSLLPVGALLYLVSKSWRNCLLFVGCCLLVALPWFFSAFLSTGHPFYPIGAGILDSRHGLNFDLWNFPKVLGDIWKLFVVADDPISPLYILVFPFIARVIGERKFRALWLYSFLALLIWYLTPRTGGGRFILPYLPVLAVLVAAVIAMTKSRVLVIAAIVVFIVNLGYRAGAVGRVAQYFLGRETKTQYLCRSLDTKITFVDCRGWYSRNIKPTDLVFISGYHNLFYVDFPFVHESWYRGEKYNYVLQP